MKLDNPDIIYEWDLKKLWNYLTTIIDQIPLIDNKTMTAIKNGKYIKHSIYHVIHEHYIEEPKIRKVNVIGYGRCDLDTFHEDIDWRSQQIRKIILENQEDESPTISRV